MNLSIKPYSVIFHSVNSNTTKRYKTRSGALRAIERYVKDSSLACTLIEQGNATRFTQLDFI